MVTPTFKSGPLLEATMRSVLDQEYPNLEYIVIDGGCDDTAREIIDRYRDRLAYAVSEPDQGQYDAINKGMAHATGDILCWLNSDDMLLPRALFVVANVLTAFPAIEWISSLKPAAWDANGYLADVGQVPGFSRDAFLDGINLPHQGRRGYWIQQESTFWRRSLWEKAGGRIPDLKLAGDLALWAAFYRHAPLVGVDYPLGGFRKIEGQRSRVSFDVYFAEAMNALDQMRADIGWRPRQAMAGSVRTYTADRIINPNLRAPVADWRLQRYGFTL